MSQNKIETLDDVYVFRVSSWKLQAPRFEPLNLWHPKSGLPGCPLSRNVRRCFMVAGITSGFAGEAPYCGLLHAEKGEVKGVLQYASCENAVRLARARVWYAAKNWNKEDNQALETLVKAAEDIEKGRVRLNRESVHSWAENEVNVLEALIIHGKCSPAVCAAQAKSSSEGS